SQILKEAAPFGLAIYGNGWDRNGAEELLPFWRGVLPLQHIAPLYSSAKVVLSTTEALQRSLGMVNNRVFEALSCGAAVVSDAFPEIEETFGDHVLYHRQAGDAARAVEYLLGNDTARAELGMRGRLLVSSRHTYASRVVSIVTTMEDVLGSRARGPSEPAPGARAEARAGLKARGDDAGGHGAVFVATAAGAAEAEPPETRAAPQSERERPFPGTGLAFALTRSLEGCAPETRAASGGATLSGERAGGLQSVGFPAAEVVPGGCADAEERSPAADRSGGVLPSPPARTTPKSWKGRPRRVTALARSVVSVDGGAEEDERACDQVFGSSEVSSFPPPSQVSSSSSSSSKPFSRRMRPNAPVVLLVYRSSCPLPGRLRHHLESAVARTTGGARMGFVGVGEVERVGGEGMGEEGLPRLKSLEAKLSRLVAAADAAVREGNSDISGLNLLGREAASETVRFMEWCCSVGMVVAYAKV
ncbi:unnamed protein product, partial [Hapterophycus canaliculatus]